MVNLLFLNKSCLQSSCSTHLVFNPRDFQPPLKSQSSTPVINMLGGSLLKQDLRYKYLLFVLLSWKLFVTPFVHESKALRLSQLTYPYPHKIRFLQRPCILMTSVQNFRLPWPSSYHCHPFPKALHFLDTAELIILINELKKLQNNLACRCGCVWSVECFYKMWIRCKI